MDPFFALIIDSIMTIINDMTTNILYCMPYCKGGEITQRQI